MKAIIGTLFFTCVVTFNSIQLSLQSSSPTRSNLNAEEKEEDFSAGRLTINTGHSGGGYYEPPNIREGHIGTPRSISYERRLKAYHEELARGGINIPAPYSPRRPPNRRRPNEELYSVPPASDGVFHNVHNHQSEIIDNYLDTKPKSGSHLTRTKSLSVIKSESESGSGSGSGSGSKSKGKWWSKSKG